MGRLLPPFFITQGEPHRPELIVWMDLPSGLVVGHHLQDPKAPVEFGETLKAVMERPIVGPPRRPARFRVASPQLAASIRRSVGEDLQIVVAPTPELNDVIEAMKSAPLRDDAPDESRISRKEDRDMTIDTVPKLINGPVAWRLCRQTLHDEGAPETARGERARG